MRGLPSGQADAVNKVGPHLNGIVGREAASVEGVRYSAAMKDCGIVWDEDRLAEYLADPRQKWPPLLGIML